MRWCQNWGCFKHQHYDTVLHFTTRRSSSFSAPQQLPRAGNWHKSTFLLTRCFTFSDTQFETLRSNLQKCWIATGVNSCFLLSANSRSRVQFIKDKCKVLHLQRYNEFHQQNWLCYSGITLLNVILQERLWKPQWMTKWRQNHKHSLESIWGDKINQGAWPIGHSTLQEDVLHPESPQSKHQTSQNWGKRCLQGKMKKLAVLSGEKN